MEVFIAVLQSIILGIVEGITEFLPVSSTGHLIIFQNIIHFKGTSEGFVEMYTYVIQLGAILAVIFLFWKKIKSSLLHFFPQKVGYEKSGFRFWLMIALACVPGVIVELTLGDLAEQYLFNPWSVAITLFLGGILIIFMENKFRNNKKAQKSLMLSPKQALIIGCFQCLAIIPGMSRSASTIIGGWVGGLTTVAAAEFSFFLSIPVMLGMSFLKLVSIGGISALTNLEIISLAVGFLVSFIVALLVVKGFITYLKKKPLRPFAIYRMIFAIVVIIAGVTGVFQV